MALDPTMIALAKAMRSVATTEEGCVTELSRIFCSSVLWLTLTF